MSELADRLGPALPARYRLMREIGRGGTARVFLAQESHPEREVAIKVLEPEITALVGSERFLREVDFASKLSHPHILPIFAAGEADGLLYYVMPYVAGDTLRDRLARERVLPLDDALRIVLDVADALSYAHGHNVIHRDIKPDNILLQAGHAIVADFGIARAITATGKGPLTGAGFVVGTPAYMSPEQAGGSEVIDGRTDIYSLGCVLYEMLTGETPHTGASPDAVIAKKLYSPVPRAAVLRPTVPESLETVLAVALARTPADRYQTAAQLREALSAALPAPAAASPASPFMRAPATPPEAPGTWPPAARAPAVRTDLRMPSSRVGLTMVLAAVVVVNWVETTVDNWIGARSGTVTEVRHQVAHAMQWLEWHMSFAGHDVTNVVALYGYATAYFFLFPTLLAAVAVAFVRRPALGPYRLLVTAIAVNYALSLPFYLLFPVPERWAFAESGAMLLSDRWTSRLIEVVRPMSGLDNCFPSFHVSLTVVAVLACFVYGLRFRWSVLAIGIAVILSTFVLGIHWVADILGGVAAGLISTTIALRLESRWGTLQPTAAIGRATAGLGGQGHGLAPTLASRGRG